MSEPTTRPESIGLQPLTDFAEVHRPGNHALRLERLQALAPQFKARFKAQGPVQAVRTLPVARAPYPVSYAYNRACTLPFPYLLFQNRALLVQFKQGGRVKNLLFNPTLPERSETAPYFAWVAKSLRAPQAVRDMLVRPSPPLPEQLRALGLGPEQIDYVAFDHQHVQDVRPYVGTASQAPLYPNAHFLVQRSDWEASVHTHPLQRWWWVADSTVGARTEKVVLLDGDYQLGEGCALLATPGHTWGNQSLYFQAPRSGCYTVSENGIGMDSYAPRHSKIPGLAAHAERTGEEVILNGNTREGTLDQYNSMVLESLLADPLPADPHFPQHFSSSELVPSLLAPGLKPTHAIGAVDEGELLRMSAAS